MKLYKIPPMEKKEYDEMIKEGYLSRIAFKGDYPYIAPFVYVFDDRHLYFLSTKYGKKQDLFKKNPHVAVEIDEYNHNLSLYRFITLQGRINQVEDKDEKIRVREMFVDMIKNKGLSLKVMAALGHAPHDPPESLLEEERSFVWKLVDVVDIVALKNGT